MKDRKQSIEFHNRAVQNVEKDAQLSYKLLVSACEVDPTCASAWYSMGNSNSDMQLLDAAVACFRRALELPAGTNPGDRIPELTVKALVNIGHRLFHLGRVKESEEMTREALRKDPGSSYALINLSMVESVKGNDKEALRLARRSYELSQEPVVGLGLAFALLFNGNYAEGLKQFEARFPYKLEKFLEYPYPRWDGALSSGTLYLVSEQGMGDALSMLRFIPEAAERVGKVVFGVQRELARMAYETLRTNGVSNVDILPIPHAFPAADFWCPIMSLPSALDLTDEEIRIAPGPKIPDYRVPTPWMSRDRFNIGIAWAGSKLNDIDKWRSIPLVHFLELCRVPGVQMYSLQVGDESQDVHRIGAATLVKDLSPIIRDTCDTAAIINELDMVITIESFVGHLAGALGKECWVPLSYNGGDWRAGRSGDRPLWYSETRLFRQGSDADWGAVFARIVTALKERVVQGRKPA